MKELPDSGRLGQTVSVLAAQIKQIILNGDLKPGDRVRDSVLADQFGVSRAPVREALRLLEQSGLISKDPNKSYLVARFTDRDIAELTSLRLSLESLAAKLALGRPHTLLAMTGPMERMRAAVLAGDPEQALRADLEFHEALVIAADHRRLREAYAIVSDQIEVAFIDLYRRPQDISALVPEHERLIRFVERGNAEDLIAALRVHILEGRFTRKIEYPAQ